MNSQAISLIVMASLMALCVVVILAALATKYRVIAVFLVCAATALVSLLPFALAGH